MAFSTLKRLRPLLTPFQTLENGPANARFRRFPVGRLLTRQRPLSGSLATRCAQIRLRVYSESTSSRSAEDPGANATVRKSEMDFSVTGLEAER